MLSDEDGPAAITVELPAQREDAVTRLGSLDHDDKDGRAPLGYEGRSPARPVDSTHVRLDQLIKPSGLHRRDSAQVPWLYTDDDEAEALARRLRPLGKTVRHAQHRSCDLEASFLGGEVEVRLPLDPIGLVVVGGSDDSVDEQPKVGRASKGLRRVDRERHGSKFSHRWDEHHPRDRRSAPIRVGLVPSRAGLITATSSPPGRHKARGNGPFRGDVPDTRCGASSLTPGAVAHWVMARKVAPMDVRVAAAVTDAEINVATFCREHRVSRDAFVSGGRPATSVRALRHGANARPRQDLPDGDTPQG